MEPNYYPNNYNLPEDDNLDIKRYISLFISNWYWFAISLFIAMSIAYSINRYSQRIYSVSSTLLIKDDQIAGVKSNVESVIPGGDIFRSQQNLKNEMGILRSFSLNYRVMKELQDFHVVYVSVGRRGIVEKLMYKSCPFKVIYDSLELEPIGTVVKIEILPDNKYRIKLDDGPDLNPVNFGVRFKEYGFDFTIVPRESGRNIFDKNSSNRYYFYFNNPENLAYEYRGKLSVAPIEKDASIVSLSVSGLVPEQEVDYLNGLMKVYIKYGLENKNGTADSTIKFIDRQINIISDSLKDAEGRMENFRKTNSFFDVSKEGTLIQEKLEKLENEKSVFELQLQYYNYLAEYLIVKNINGTIISPSVMGVTDQVLLRLVNELSVIKDEKEKLNFNLEINQPALELIDRQAEETIKALMENVRNGIAGLKLSIEESDRNIAAVDTLINRLPTTEKKFINIQRKFQLNNTVYTYLLEKRAESGIAKASNLPDNRIIDYASSGGPIKPKTRSNIVIAFMLGLILPMIGIALIDYFNDKVIDKRDVEKKTKVPVIGYISHSESKSEIPVVEKPGSSLAESFRSVRTSIKFFIKDNEKPVIAVSSTISSEGKTFISINIAAITALLGKRVLLIGLDLRKPRINRVFEFEKSPGMSTYLSGNCKYEEVIKETQIKNLFYAPSGPIPPNPAELIATENMRIFLEKAKNDFDYVIIDTPPIAIVTDALLLAPYVDLNLFIVRQRYSSRSTVEMIDQLYRRGELKNLAIIINDINLTGYYGYGMRYGYYLGYGYSYGYNYYGKGYYGKYGYSDKASGYYTDEK
ncbi:MAG: polysaccharide biosynthesis tyrosine autokinase [Bacteroidales bacterium]|jgi:capsular exopolysaccharide synthesis family protein